MQKSSVLFLLASFGVALIACMLLYPGLDGGFLFDDKVNLVTNTSLHLRRWNLDDLLYATYSFQPGHGSRSLSMLSFALDHFRAGLDARAFKVTSIAIHGVTVVVLTVFYRQLLAITGIESRSAAWVALAMTAAWAWHPMQVSSVLYVVQRMQTLSTLFLLLGLIAYLSMRAAQIEGRRSSLPAVLGVLAWVLAIAAKEDGILLPLYALVIEFTVLRFRAASSRTEAVLKGGAIAAVAGSLLIYAVFVLPHFWSWQAYPGRDFSSAERLLTEGRVLCIYLGQLLVPIPSNFPFFYDWLPVSRGLMQPPSTLASIGLLGLLLGITLALRLRRPLLACGVFLFFMAHVIDANVIGLELAFEHRNHFALVGLVLAIGDLVFWITGNLTRGQKAAGTSVAFLLFLLASGTLARAHTWGDPERLARSLVEITPKSDRAWMQLASIYIERAHVDPRHPDFNVAIDLSKQGAAATGSPGLLANLVIFKTIRGDVTSDDWHAFLDRYHQVPMSAQNMQILWANMNNIDSGIALDERGMLEMIDIVTRQAHLRPDQYMRLGAYIHNETHSPGKALPLLKRAVSLSPKGDPDIEKMLEQLHEAGRDDWVHELRAIPRAARD